MKAIILAGGFSTRLYPLTHKFPKGLLPLGGQELASYVADDILRTPAISETALVTTACFEADFGTWIDKRYPGKIRLIGNGVTCLEERLGAIGDLLFALEKTGWDDDILVATSDTYSSLKIADFVAFFNRHPGVATVAYLASSPAVIANRLGCATLKGERVTAFIEKPAVPPSLYIGVPFYLFPKASLASIRQYRAEGHKLDAPGSIITWFLEREPVYAYEMKGYYYDVGTPQAYHSLQAALASNGPRETASII